MPSMLDTPVRETILDRARDVVADVLGIDRATLGPETRFAEDLCVDSIRQIELLFVLEEEFGVEIEEPAGLGLRTIGDVAEWIEHRLRADLEAGDTGAAGTDPVELSLRGSP